MACAGMILCLLSCKTKTDTASIVGKWQYDKMEKGPKTTDDAAAKYDKDNKGHTIEFFKDGKYVSLQTPSDTDETGTWEVSADVKKVITHNHGRTDRGDTVNIADLTATVLSVITPDGDKFYLKRLH